jgi:hypothetical protein
MDSTAQDSHMAPCFLVEYDGRSCAWVPSSKATWIVPGIPRRDSTIAGPCVSSTLRASTRPLSSRTEITWLLDARRTRHTWWSVS